MKCPACGHSDTSVAWTRDADDRIKRARACAQCGQRFQTTEVLCSFLNLVKEIEATGRAIIERVTNAPSRSPTWLYRHFSADGNLLYIGITNCTETRRLQHRRRSPWFRMVERIDVQLFANRTDALEAERTAIKAERPQYNVTGARRG